MMSNTSKGCRYGGNKLSISNSQHAKNWYSKQSLTNDNICKLSVQDSTGVMIYWPLYSTTTTSSSWTKDIKNAPPLHDKQPQTTLLLTQKIAYITRTGKMKRTVAAAVRCGPWQWIAITKRLCHVQCMLILLIFNSNEKLTGLVGATVTSQYELSQITEYYWFDLFIPVVLKNAHLQCIMFD